MKETILMILFFPLYGTATILLILSDIIIMPMYYISNKFYDHDHDYFDNVKRFYE